VAYPSGDPAQYSAAPAPYPGSPPPADYQQPGYAQPGYQQSGYAQPGFPPTSGPPGGYPTYFPPTPPPAKSHRGLWIAVIALIVVVLGGGGTAIALVLNRPSDGTGRPSAESAVQDFLQAIYVDQNPTKAEPLVCAAARDKQKLAAKVDEIKQQDKQYESPKYTWTNPKTDESGSDRAVLSTTVTLTTANVQRATQKLRIIAIHSSGWFVCDVLQQP
jgi:hypothetical protein